jgi:hypothetical protein
MFYNSDSISDKESFIKNVFENKSSGAHLLNLLNSDVDAPIQRLDQCLID